MAKLVALLLALTALVAFASAQTSSQQQHRQCSRQLQRQNLNECQRYLHQGSQSPFTIPFLSRESLQPCCQELQNIDEQCQCAAMQQVFRDVQRQQQQQQQQGGWSSDLHIRAMKQMAQNIPNQCNPQMRQQCQIGTYFITTTTIIEDTYDNPRIPVRQQTFNQCQRYIEQELQYSSPRTLLMSINRQGGPRTLLMSINRQGGQQSGEIRECCNELENVPAEWQCEALYQVLNQVIQQQQRQQGDRRGGEQELVRRVVENIRSNCNLQVQQCRIPSSMF